MTARLRPARWGSWPGERPGAVDELHDGERVVRGGCPVQVRRCRILRLVRRCRCGRASARPDFDREWQRRFAGGTHPDVGLPHNLDRSLLEQLPVELRLTAPFVDPSGHAVRELIERFAPRRLRVALQRDLSSLDGRALLSAAGRVGDVEFRGVDDRHMMDCKLIEWTTPAGRTTAVAAAPTSLPRPCWAPSATGHNCELAVSAPVTTSLLPEAKPLTAAEIADVVWNRPDVDVGGPGLRLLGCRRSDDGLMVELVSRHAVP